MGDTTHVTLLGPVMAFRDGQGLELGSPRQRTLFAVLAAHANQVISREELVTAVWGLDAPATAMNSVYTYVARLRRLLEPARSQRGPSDLLVSDSLGYRLQLPPSQVDFKRFKAHLKRARRLKETQAVERAVQEINAALALWHGAPYGGATGPFADAERRALTELRLTAIEDRMELLHQLEHDVDFSGELSELSSLVRKYPLRERLRHLLMLGYTRFGRQVEAVEEYHDLRTRLAEEQGLEPGERIQRFYEDILRIGPSSRMSLPLPEAEPAGPPSVPTASGRAAPPTQLAQLARDIPDFTGRAAELRQLRQLVESAESAGESAVILINGAPGIGKTAVAIRIAHALSPRFPDGQLQLDLRGYGDGPGPMQLDEALRHLLDALGAPPRAGMDIERQRTLLRSLVAGRRLLILLDNAAYVQQVRPLLLGDASCLVIVTSRNSLTGLTVRDGARRITLSGMAEDGVELFGRMVGRPLAAHAETEARRLVEACGGIPLALRIAGTRIGMYPAPERALARFCEGDLLGRLDVLGDDHSSLKTVFGWSYDPLPEDVRLMFRALGGSTKPGFGLKSAGRLAGITPRVARRGLDVLVEESLVQEPVHDHFRLNPLIFAYARHLYHRDMTLGATPTVSC
ncbi:BTAD domain-containing putative transcriptional regulator [Streptomyces sp. NPDC015032]|uniref:AfsR/SARP family transcriptional regulator n=1 Tax=Streptomyces sp. NPDC015032 TaxID=3364937 RepID=UPI0036FC5E9B